jgi:hypothetical protein
MRCSQARRRAVEAYRAAAHRMHRERPPSRSIGSTPQFWPRHDGNRTNADLTPMFTPMLCDYCRGARAFRKAVLARSRCQGKQRYSRLEPFHCPFFSVMPCMARASETSGTIVHPVYRCIQRRREGSIVGGKAENLGSVRSYLSLQKQSSSADGTWAAARELGGHAGLSNRSGATSPHEAASSTAPHNRSCRVYSEDGT